MKVKRIKKIRINSRVFDIVWDRSYFGGEFDYGDSSIRIGTKGGNEGEIFEIVCHEMYEMAMVECSVRMSRPDVYNDYIFVLDHRQFTTVSQIFAGLIQQFIG